jgi:hypothetical protein
VRHRERRHRVAVVHEHGPTGGHGRQPAQNGAALACREPVGEAVDENDRDATASGNGERLETVCHGVVGAGHQAQNAVRIVPGRVPPGAVVQFGHHPAPGERRAEQHRDAPERESQGHVDLPHLRCGEDANGRSPGCPGAPVSAFLIDL